MPALPDAPPRPPRSTAAKVGVGLAVASTLFVLGMWAWVLVYHGTGAWRSETPGRIEGEAFGTEAEATCLAAMGRIDQLPPAFAAQDAAERADGIVASNAILDEMIAELHGLEPLAGDQAAAVDEWLDDWSTYVDDRDAFADRLRSDPDARFYVTQSERDQRQITVAIDRFANINAMPSCKALNDLG